AAAYPPPSPAISTPSLRLSCRRPIPTRRNGCMRRWRGSYPSIRARGLENRGPMTEMTGSASPIASEGVEQGVLYTFHELCISCNVSPDWVAGLVEQGAIEAVGPTRQEWQFTALSLIRIAKAKRLERDLDLNLPGIALVLDLLDQLDAVH